MARGFQLKPQLAAELGVTISCAEVTMRAQVSVLLSVFLFISLAETQTVPAGTKLKVRIPDDSETLARSYQFHAELVDDVSVGGKVVLRRGTAFLGERDEGQDASTVQLTLLRLQERDYPIATSTVLVGGSKAAQNSQRRQQGVQAAADAVREAVTGRALEAPGSTVSANVSGLVQGQVLQFKLRKNVKIDEPPPRKPSQ